MSSSIIALLCMVTIMMSVPVSPVISEKETLAADIAGLPYSVSDIVYNVFDCSDTVCIAHNELTKKGWDVRILVLSRADKRNHAMIKVYGENRNYYIECTRKRLVSATPLGYTGIDEYVDVVDVLEHSGYKTSEWDYNIYIEQLERKRK